MFFIIKVLLIGLGAGLLAGLFGVGGGILIVPCLLLLGKSIHQATGTSLAIIVPTALVGSLFCYQKGTVDLRLAALVALGSCLSVILGATTSLKIEAPLLRKLFGVFLLLISLDLMGICNFKAWAQMVAGK